MAWHICQDLRIGPRALSIDCDGFISFNARHAATVLGGWVQGAAEASGRCRARLCDQRHPRCLACRRCATVGAWPCARAVGSRRIPMAGDRRWRPGGRACAAIRCRKSGPEVHSSSRAAEPALTAFSRCAISLRTSHTSRAPSGPTCCTSLLTRWRARPMAPQRCTRVWWTCWSPCSRRQCWRSCTAPSGWSGRACLRPPCRCSRA